MVRNKDTRALRRKVFEECQWYSFGSTIKDARLMRHLTLDALAKKVGTHKGYISGIELGKVNPPSPKMIEKLGKVLGLGVPTLLLLAWIEKAPITILPEALMMRGRLINRTLRMTVP